MKITGIEKLDECTYDTLTLELTLDRPVNSGVIRRMDGLGRLLYYPRFETPFYRVMADPDFILKGDESSDKIKAIFLKEDESDRLLRNIASFFENLD